MMWYSSIALTLSYLLFAGQVDAQSLKPSKGSLSKPARVVYCPFDVEVSLAPDVSSIDIAYSTSKPDDLLFSQETAKCYIQAEFTFEKTKHTIHAKEISYSGELEGGGNGKLETLLAWSSDRGPKRYTPVQLSPGNTVGVATNTTYAVPLECGNTDFEWGQLNLQTTFSGVGIGAGLRGVLVQRIKFSWGLPQLSCMAEDHCFQPDIDGKLADPFGVCADVASAQ